MREKKLLRWVSGCMAGLFAGSLLINEGNFIRYYILTGASSWAGTVVQVLAYLLAALVFFFIARYFWTGEDQSLTSFYLKAVLVSAAAVILALYIILGLIVRLVPISVLSDFFETPAGIFVQYHVIYVLFAFLVLIFSSAFSGITKKKVEYIQMISREIKKIEQEGFGKTIEVYGEDELADLCASINHMSRELGKKEEREKQMEQQKKELITNVSHDLRSPLTSIIGYVELLKQDTEVTPEQYQEYIGVVECRLQGLHHLINELFELTKLDSEDIRLSLERTNLSLLFWHMAEEYGILYGKRGFHIRNVLESQPFYMEADGEKLARAIQNLLDNAGKYTKEGGMIEITSRLQKEGERPRLQLVITNEIEENQEVQIEHIFDRSFKGDTARSDSESSGLGLAIARRIVELHHGTLTARQEKNYITFEILV